MANEKFTQLPTVTNAAMSDIIAAVQSGTSSQETLQQVFDLFLDNTILNNAGNPNGSVAGETSQLCWDRTNSILYVCTTSGNAATAVWTKENITSLGVQSQALNMGNNLINNVLTPVSGTDAVNKSYVDNIVLNVHPACNATTTATLNATYSNGTLGVGATLTNAGAMAAFSVDGYSASANDRILVKNQSSPAQNGIYTVTTVGSGAANWVLTRSTDYDQAADMQAGDKFAVVNGAVNAATEWMMTQTATITVGTTAITFAEMGQTTAALTAINTQIFTSNNTYTPTTGMTYCTVEIVGGGGGAGGITGGTIGQAAISGGGGGAGYCKKLYTLAQIGASAAVVIGSGGAGGASGGGNGSTGGNSTFTPTGSGVTLTAAGGFGGTGITESAAAQIAPGGARGIGSNGDLNISGNDGSPGITLPSAGGAFDGTGGSSYLSSSSECIGQSGSGGGTGGANGGYGSGATGRYSVAAGGSTGAGQPGANGVCIITEYISTAA